MGAPTENQFYKLRKDFGGDGRKLSIEQVLTKAQEYIDYCRNEPLKETDFRGKDAIKVTVPKMRAMHIKGLCHWLGITHTTWIEWKKDKKYSKVIAHVEQVMYAYKFEGAAAGFLNPNIIARDLGLVEKKEIDQKQNIKVQVKDEEPPQWVKDMHRDDD